MVSTRKTVKTTPYDANFLQHLINHGVFPPKYRYPSGEPTPKPSNWDEIYARTFAPRASLSSVTGLAELANTINDELEACTREAEVTCCIPLLRSKTDNPKQRSMEGRFSGFYPLTDGTLTCSSPDMYYGAPPEDLPEKFQETFKQLIMPSSRKSELIIPNFFLALKGPASAGGIEVAKNQACYDGAMGARALSFLTSVGAGRRLFDNRAYTITSFMHGGSLKLYTSHIYESRSQQRVWECATTLVRVCTLDGDVQQCKEALTAFRNLVDWSREQRTATLTRAKDVLERCGRADAFDCLVHCFSRNQEGFHRQPRRYSTAPEDFKDPSISMPQDNRGQKRSRLDRADCVDTLSSSTCDERDKKRSKVSRTSPSPARVHNLRPRPSRRQK